MKKSPINWWRIDVGEREAACIQEAIQKGWISQGPLTRKFERELAGILNVPYVVCTTSGTSALMMSCLAAGVGPGTEVIVPDRTWVATANAPMLLGSQVKVLPMGSRGTVMDPTGLEKLITSRTRAILPVHLNGCAVEIKKIIDIAQMHNITVIEDACQAFLSRSHAQCLGTFGHFGCFSLGMAKCLTTGQGGFVVCHSEENWHTLIQIRDQGLNPMGREANNSILGGNFKFTDIQAAMGLGQLEQLPRRLEHQKNVYRAYQKGLENLSWITLLPVDIAAGEIPFRADCISDWRDRIVKKLHEHDIFPGIQPANLHEYSHLSVGDFVKQNCPMRGKLLILPSGPDQPMENVEQTIQVLRSMDEELKAIS
ncbi:MAG: DegT/DnrJ/EryC1/StrS family aminotransferase [Magnetococcus sp. THC-1_WYH]